MEVLKEEIARLKSVISEITEENLTLKKKVFGIGEKKRFSSEEK